MVEGHLSLTNPNLLSSPTSTALFLFLSLRSTYGFFLFTYTPSHYQSSSVSYKHHQQQLFHGLQQPILVEAANEVQVEILAGQTGRRRRERNSPVEGSEAGRGGQSTRAGDWRRRGCRGGWKEGQSTGGGPKRAHVVAHLLSSFFFPFCVLLLDLDATESTFDTYSSGQVKDHSISSFTSVSISSSLFSLEPKLISFFPPSSLSQAQELVRCQHDQQPEVQRRFLPPSRLLRAVQVLLQPLLPPRRSLPVHPCPQDR